MHVAVVPTLVALLLLFPATARAEIIAQASEALSDDPVYVHPAAESAFTRGELRELRARVEESPVAPIRIAVLPPAALHEASGSLEGALMKVAAGTSGEPGIYAVAVPGVGLEAGSNGVGGSAAARKAADRASRTHGAHIGPLLLDFVADVSQLTPADSAEAVAARDASSGAGVPNEEGTVGTGAIVLLGAGALLFAGALLAGRARRRRDDREFEEAKENARDDLVAFGDDLRALDFDLDLPGAPPEAYDDYSRALSSYERAERAWKAAAAPDELERVSAALEEGRWAMASTAARLAGEEPPVRRPPCFFDPRHGPSTRDVDWSPPYGRPRAVPACEADATRVERGEDPDARQVSVGGRATPYWNAGRAYAPFASGFFGGAAAGLLPAILAGTVLGTALHADDASAADLDTGGDFGGGDFGGGFGGGDFGGGL